MFALSRRVFILRIAFALILVLAIALPAADLVAQDEEEGQDGQEEPEGLDELKEERERVAREAALAAQNIDVRTATVEEVTRALDEIAEFVAIQELRLGEAEASHQSSVDAVNRAEDEREAILVEAELIREQLADLAVRSFTGESGASSDDVTELILSDDPGESARFLHLLELQTGNLGDGLDRLRGLEFEADALVGEQEEAASRAAESLGEVEERSAELDAALEQQALIVASAELRLEAQLAEAAFLLERDLALSSAISAEQTEINDQIIASALSQGIEIPAPVNLDDIALISFYRPEEGVEGAEEVEETIDPETGEVVPPIPPIPAVDAEPFFQIEVNVAIEEQTRQLYQLAFDQGIDLGGWGYRPIQRQVQLRAAHCGGTTFDIWHKPAFQCAPPTARPGFSKHEQGRAIDFQWNGHGIGSRNSEAFRWLQANAPQFGFVNLPSEPWHWSISEGDERLPE